MRWLSRQEARGLRAELAELAAGDAAKRQQWEPVDTIDFLDDPELDEMIAAVDTIAAAAKAWARPPERAVPVVLEAGESPDGRWSELLADLLDGDPELASGAEVADRLWRRATGRQLVGAGWSKRARQYRGFDVCDRCEGPEGNGCLGYVRDDGERAFCAVIEFDSCVERRALCSCLTEAVDEPRSAEVSAEVLRSRAVELHGARARPPAVVEPVEPTVVESEEGDEVLGKLIDRVRGRETEVVPVVDVPPVVTRDLVRAGGRSRRSQRVPVRSTGQSPVDRLEQVTGRGFSRVPETDHWPRLFRAPEDGTHG